MTVPVMLAELLRAYSMRVQRSSALVVVSPWSSTWVALPNEGSYCVTVRVVVCPAGSAGYRLQVNWLDDAGGFLDADIEVQPCTDAFEQHSMRVTAPLLARTALVYASGQDAVAMAEFDRVSFRE